MTGASEVYPMKTTTECKFCGHRLGAQNPGNVCTPCKYIGASVSQRATALAGVATVVETIHEVKP